MRFSKYVKIVPEMEEGTGQQAGSESDQPSISSRNFHPHWPFAWGFCSGVVFPRVLVLLARHVRQKDGDQDRHHERGMIRLVGPPSCDWYIFADPPACVSTRDGTIVRGACH